MPVRRTAYGTVVVEDFNVAGMVKNRKLVRSIADAGFGEIRWQLTYKTAWTAQSRRPLVPQLENVQCLRQREPQTAAAGTHLHLRRLRRVLDRDENAALNLDVLT